MTEREREEQRLLSLLDTFPQYTTAVEGAYDTLGVVFGTAVLGANVIRDVLTDLTNLIGGRSGTYQRLLDRSRRLALAEMCDQAAGRGADLVAGIRLDYETMDKMLIVSASGTALRKTE